MAKKTEKPAAEDDLLGAPGDDLLSGKPATPSKPTTKKAAVKKATATAEPAPAATPKKPAAKKAAAPVEAANGTTRGQGKFYMSIEDKEALAKKIAGGKKPITTAEAAAKFEVETWQVRRAMNEVLVAQGKGSLEKTGQVLTYTPA